MEMHLSTSLVVLWLLFYWVNGKNQVEQRPLSLTILEGENCTIHCNYTVSPFNNLRWYKQDTERGLISLIIMTFSESKKSNGRYTATLDATTMHSTLHITAAWLSVPATYICVVGALCSSGI
uniref:Ig-like domain-containing protein n=1 Tax=Sus scrofa TaxID=9823 RepID=A0A4X1UWS8_PIG